MIGKRNLGIGCWGLACVLVLALAPQSASARWASVQEVTLGTAQVLEQGALTFGVVSPIAYGYRNDVMLESHPVLDLLLVPNLAGRWRILDRPSFVLSMAASYRQSFFKVTGTANLPSAKSIEATGQKRDSLHSRGSPGEFNIGPVATWYPNRRFAVTAGANYAVLQGTDGGVCTVVAIPGGGVKPVGCPAGKDYDCVEGRCVGESTAGHGLAGAVELHWLLQPEDLLVASATLRYDFSRGSMDTPTVGIWWAHGFQTALNGAHLLLGVSAGQFRVRGLLDDEESTWPLFPFADLWWRL